MLPQGLVRLHHNQPQMYSAGFHALNPFPHRSINYLEVKIMSDRGVKQVFTAPRAQDGDGGDLRRAFPGATTSDLDPCLILDQMGPPEFAAGESWGFPPHSH